MIFAWGSGAVATHQKTRAGIETVVELIIAISIPDSDGFCDFQKMLKEGTFHSLRHRAFAFFILRFNARSRRRK